MKKIVFVNQSSGYLMTDIINVFCKEYDEVVLIAGSVKENDRKPDSRLKLQKIIAYNRTSNIKRIFTWLWGGLQIFFLLALKYRKHEVFYVTNPPTSYLAQLVLKHKFYILIYDTFPDAFKNIGVSESDFLYKKWSKWNQKIFPQAEQIFTIGESMKKQLSKYIDESKIKVIPNWSASEDFKPVVKAENPFVVEHNLQNKFVVMYSGNIGMTHNVEVLMDVANLLRKDKEIVFLIIGEGKKKADLIQMAEKLDLENCIFLTWQKADKLRWSLAAADIAVVTLNEETATLSVPSKTYNLMAVGVPILAIASENSELADIFKKYDNGRVFNMSDVDKIVAFITSCKHNREFLSELSFNSLKASKDFTYKNAEKYLF